MASYVEKWNAALEEFLYQPGKVDNILTEIEARTGVKRRYIALGEHLIAKIIPYTNGMLRTCRFGFIFKGLLDLWSPISYSGTEVNSCAISSDSYTLLTHLLRHWKQIKKRMIPNG